uniref:AAA+ ATPase domain-containing protein n=1 Tax=Globisporangium ultimum (strain ATCC 200006 / CBS 805.95 / DAOM BR144) TaxID=431595 RepID=K3WXT2_GLOUD
MKKSMNATIPLHYVTTTAALQALLVRSHDRFVLFDANVSLRVALYFKTEQDAAKQATKPFTAIVLSDGATQTVILHLTTSLSDVLVRSVLIELLENKCIVKVMHGADKAVPRLIRYGLGCQMKLVQCACLKLAYAEWLGIQGNVTIMRIAQECEDAVSTLEMDASRTAHDNHCASVPRAWSKDKLVTPLLEFLKHHVLLYLALYDVMATKARAVGSVKIPTENAVMYVNTTAMLQKLVSPSGGFNLFDAKTAPLVALHFNALVASDVKPMIALAAGNKALLLDCYNMLIAKQKATEPKVASSSTNQSARSIESTYVRYSSSDDIKQKPVPLPAALANVGATVVNDSITYVRTTADFQTLILSRGTAGLFDSKTTSVVALQFHVPHDDDDDDDKSSPATDQGMVIIMTSRHRTNGDASGDSSDDLVDDSFGDSAGVDATSASATKTDTVVLRLLPSLSQQLVSAVLTLILQNPGVVKVMHNIHHAAFWLHRYGLAEVGPVNCVDLQLAYEHAVDATTRDADLAQIAEHCGVSLEKTSYRDTLLENEPLASSHGPLSKKRLQTLVYSSHAALACYASLVSSATGALRKKSIRGAVAGMTCRRWRNAIVNQGVAAIWFDSANDYLARSVECLEEELMKVEDENGESTTMTTFTNDDFIPKLQLQCDLEPLLSLLPEKYRAPILAIDGFHDKLVDICLDVGRFPHVYVGKGQRVPLGEGEVVSRADINEVLEKLGGEHKIGFDNRAGIDRQLHRISVMRSKTGEIYGLTMRVGRALAHAANLLTDVLMSAAHRDKSILLLGRPGSGKTTLIRDIARSVSDTQENVCIIDTSNEIGGDGLVPHECVGWARRMMVPSLEQQANVMIECVQNHTVETLIIDEIGRKAEVNAAGTVRQRGPRLIASGHGDFRSLIRNQDLRGLIGGVQQVTVGDVAMQKSASKSKLQAERAGAPIFDIIVELDHVDRGQCQLIWDVGAAVDSVLSGRGYRCEVRKQAFDAHGILSP